MDFDIAIVGGGPGGLSAALAAVKAGATSVALFERKQRWGAPVQCAGYVPRLLGRILPFDSSAVRARVDSLRLFHEGNLLKDVRSPGYIIRREVLESGAAEAALRAGVRTFQPARMITIEHSRLIFEEAGGTSECRAQVIIGADGPRSIVRRAMELPDQPLAMGLEYELETTRKIEAAEIHFSPKYGAGYAWIFPHSEHTAGVGLALDPDQYIYLRQMLHEFLEMLKKEQRIKSDEPHRIIAGPVPIGGPVESTVEGAMMLVGDAAGQTNPLTGAGIFNAAACGEIAGKIAARAVLQKDFDLLRYYETEWRDLMDLLLIRALRGREKVVQAEAAEHRGRMMEAWNVRTKKSEKSG